jgi:predicted MFS family arabinose efflux permease
LKTHSLTTAELAIVTAARLALITAFRVIYPLQPFLSEHLQVDLRTVSLLATVQVLASIVSPIGGIMADTRGERMTMSFGLLLFCIGTLLCALADAFGGFLMGYALIGLGVAIFQPASQSYLSARTTYAQRGRVIGMFESSWAFAALLGVAPLMFLVQTLRDSSPVFWLLLVAGLASLLLIQLALPPAPHRGGLLEPRRISPAVLRLPGVAALLLAIASVMGAYDLYNVVAGPWQQARFGANEAALGQVAGVMGIAELIGAAAVTLLVDRFGKRRSLAISLVLWAFALGLAPLTEGNWPALLGVTFVIFLLSEFAIITFLTLASGVAPEARGTLIALTVTVNGLGRVVGSLVSEPIWSTFGIGTNVGVAALLIIFGVFCFLRVPESEKNQEHENQEPKH